MDPAATTDPRQTQPRTDRGEALALLHAEGYDALSMRRLGHRLNAGATSLYTHVANKDELLELVVDEALGEIAVPGDPTPQNWRAEVLTLACEGRGLLPRRPWILTVLSSVGLAYLGPNMLRMLEGMLEIVAVVGVDDDNADRVANAVFA
ncbi:TetR/AcrR family transcriptional regulator [Nocardia abscessus]|uniref:TetR/AcrR family transcriptional regulator n=1 Tax=Nocardia abscessus TaxID=120957 RepID=UPI0024540F1C|nr:helix-turn-helix domain-containing protein [Nocardia abscessus]